MWRPILFIMAAVLIHIKSNNAAAARSVGESGGSWKIHDELVNRLLEHEKFKSAGADAFAEAAD